MGIRSMKLYVQCPFCDRDVYVDQPRINGAYICPHCGVKFTNVYSLVKPETEFSTIAGFLADELKEDISNILSLGIKLEKGKLASKAGGLGWAGYEVFTGDWLTALLAGGLSLIAGGLTDTYGRIKLQEMRLKWFEILNGLTEVDLSCLMAMIQQKYPLLLSQVKGLLQAQHS
jgi:hypothetical protein